MAEQEFDFYIVSYYNREHGGDIPPDLHIATTEAAARRVLQRVQSVTGPPTIYDVYGLHGAKGDKTYVIESITGDTEEGEW